ncbi:MAG: hypothetical protein C0469_03800 [Cyanobacteria bacterium DS2.3.42]|nr:hypothetical protein [Cyanobacteria bacterium DS2.3.42]
MTTDATLSGVQDDFCNVNTKRRQTKYFVPPEPQLMTLKDKKSQKFLLGLPGRKDPGKNCGLAE